MLNEAELEYLGVLNWHRKGYKGRNAVICSKENVIGGVFDDIDAIEFEDDHGRFSVHGTNVMDYIRQVAPEARKMTAETSGRTKNGVLYSAGMDYMQKVLPDILTTSTWGTSDTSEPLVTLYKQLLDKGVFLCCCAGNYGTKGCILLTKSDVWKAIGACHYNNGKVFKASYSSIGDEIDFCSLSHLKATWNDQYHNGTSFASPMFAAMLALVQGFFLDKTGRKLNHEQLIKFVKDNCIDFDKDGWDNWYGHGLFVLPDPDTIDVFKYTTMITIDEVFDYLQQEGELLEPAYWKKKIAEEDKIKWLFIKWANAVRMARGLGEKDFSVIDNYDIKDVLNELHTKGYLLEPEYWKQKIAQEDKLKWLFFKWYYATKRVI